MAERALFSTFKLPPYFWNKKKCPDINLTIYRLNTRLHKVFRAVIKNYSEKLVWDAFKKLKVGQLKKLISLVKYNKTSEIIATLQYYCQNEEARIKRLNKPKDIGNPININFEAGKDLRKKRVVDKKKNLWKFLNGDPPNGKKKEKE